MSRLRLVLIACALTFSSVLCLAGPPSAGQDPLLREVARVDPEKLEAFKNTLTMLQKADIQTVTHKGMRPTDSEEAQIAANPAFARAFERDPVGTLALLREINDDLNRRRAASATVPNGRNQP
jgi:hypothetical protein